MIGAVIAMEREAEILLSQMEREDTQTIYGKAVHFGKAFGKELLLVVCGVGKVNAAIGACAAIQKGADLLLNFGVAGGLNGQTELTELYLIRQAVQYDFDLTQINGGVIGTLNEETENYFPLFLPSVLDYPVRRLATGDRFNDSAEDYRILTQLLHADIRDMEGAAIAQVCKTAGLPFVCIKAISDVYGAEVTTMQYQKTSHLAILNLAASLAEIFDSLA